MMPPTQEVEFSLTYSTVSFYSIWNPIRCRFTNLRLWHPKVVLVLTLVHTMAESSLLTVEVESTRGLRIVYWNSHHISLAQQEIRLCLQVHHIAIRSLFLFSCCPAPSSHFVIVFHFIFNHFGIHYWLTIWLHRKSTLSNFNTILVIQVDS